MGIEWPGLDEVNDVHTRGKCISKIFIHSCCSLAVNHAVGCYYVWIYLLIRATRPDLSLQLHHPCILQYTVSMPVPTVQKSVKHVEKFFTSSTPWDRLGKKEVFQSIPFPAILHIYQQLCNIGGVSTFINLNCEFDLLKSFYQLFTYIFRHLANSSAYRVIW